MNNIGDLQDQQAQIDRLKAEIAALHAERDSAVLVPIVPTPGLLMSMAMRYDHALALPGYYDKPRIGRYGDATHAQVLEATLSQMRQLHEEVAGTGFYSPDREAFYVAKMGDTK